MINEIVKNLRALMKDKGLDAYLITSTDPHQNEYLPQHWNRCEFISGFTGTYCHITITQKEAMVWTDGKEELKVKKELKGTPFKYYVKELVTSDLSLEINWFAERLPNNSVLGIDPQTVTVSQMDALKEILKKKNIKTQYTNPNLIDLIWDERPALSKSPVIFRDKKYEPVSAVEKINKLHKIMKEKGVDIHVVSNLESIARLLNARGNDIEYTPLVVSYLIVTSDHVLWFVNKKRIKDLEHLTANVTVFDYEEFAKELKAITEGRTVLVDPNEVSQWIINNISTSAKIVKETSPLSAFKGIKTPAEIKHIINANIKDSISLIKAICWTKNTVGKKKLTEYEVSKKIIEFKKQEKGFVDLCFESLVAYGKNAAIIHYHAEEKNSPAINKKGMLLLDAGGNYLDGTSDITRTISVGPVTPEMKKAYTMVLKGHLSLANAKFPKGTRGYHLDTLARRPIWDEGLNFYHGTGHGLGYCTCVHETSGVGISPLKSIIIDEGMVLTNEPGYYKEGHYGVRIENCLYVAKNTKLSKINGKNAVLEFKELTMCPYEISLIETEKLSKEEINWVNNYHKLVIKTLTPRIKDKHLLAWLKTACRTI
jgi:Xaa-Pro aminopeptidase